MTSPASGTERSPLIVFSPNRWSEPWSSRHRIATGLAARGWPVVYTSGPLSLWERGGDEWAASGLFGKTRPENSVSVDRPGRLESYWPGSAAWAAFSSRRHAARLRREARRGTDASEPLTAFLFHPKFWPAAQALSPDRVVYFSYDAISLSPGWDDRLATLEADLVNRADLIVAYSAAMFDYMPERARRIGRELPTGVDIAHFEGAAERPCPPDLAAVPSPRIGYTGHINQKLDLALMVDVARAAPHLNFVFVGPAGPGNGGVFRDHPRETEAWSALTALPNVHHLGPKDFADVPAYMGNMDVNIMCYRLEGGWWQAGYPLKMHEYLAVAKPVVSTGLHSILPFGSVVDIAADATAWTAALERALDGGGMGTPAQRHDVAVANSWDNRLDLLSQWLTEAEVPGS